MQFVNGDLLSGDTIRFVFWHSRGAAAAGVGGGEPAAEASGGGFESGPGSAEGSDPKKRLELVGGPAVIGEAVAILINR